MQLRKKILSYFLLATYLLVSSHLSFCHNTVSHFCEAFAALPSHQHEGFAENHHDSHFHIGIFHFLGHLVDSTHHEDDLADKHFHTVITTTIKKVVDLKSTSFISFDNIKLALASKGVKSLRAPPYLPGLKQALIFSNAPLRAPPALV
ncbi:MAG: hypothetical protein MI974_20025 [Chitinophagales bacterium]|nr:hypothetical protein [Chitinophagales bacterium]